MGYFYALVPGDIAEHLREPLAHFVFIFEQCCELLDCVHAFLCCPACGYLLHRNTLPQVPWLVYVAASADGYVVGEELQGDYFEDGEEEFVGLGDVDGVGF
jgi:hypothetical protein